MACDLGPGLGQNSLYLALSGYDVVAIEHDAVAAARLRSVAARHGLPIHVRRADLATTALRERFAIVCATHVLHFFEPAVIRALLARLQRATAPGGVHVIATFRTTGRRGERVRFARDELRAIYAAAGWEILEYRELRVKPATSDRRYPYAALLARRPVAAVRARRRPAERRSRSTKRSS